MEVPQKTRYALRAIFELAKHFGQDPVKVIDIAKAQATPPRFLEVILNQLKKAGFVGSKRGSRGGYFLVRSPDKLTVGEVMRTIQGPIRLVDCADEGSQRDCPLISNCVFLPMWTKVQEAISDVYDTTTFQDFLDAAEQSAKNYVPGYTI